VAAVVACVALCVGAGSAAAAVPAWTTYHHDSSRSAVDPDSTSPVAPTRLWQTAALDGKVYGQPLVYATHVYVATENDTVYSLDAATGAIVWQKHLATAVSSGQLQCGNISPTVGVTSTPAIDPATGRIYVVADTWDGSDPASIAHEMFSLNLSDGSIAAGPVPVDPPGSTPADQLQRASLALDAGKVIIGYGGNDGDCGTYHGWLVAVPEGGGPLQTFEVDASGNGGAVWASGNAPPVDSNGDIWAATGNDTLASGYDHQESVLKLDPNLNLRDFWAPPNWFSLDGGDTDIGSSMPLLLPGGLVFQIGKSGDGYLLDASNLGGVSGPSYSQPVCSGSWGGGTYYRGVIYVACADGMNALVLNTITKTFTPVAGWTVNPNAVAPPIVAGGLVWSVGASVTVSNGVLYGLDPTTGATRFSVGLGVFEHFASPSAAGGRLFVANGTKITAFQIASPPGPSPTSLTLSSVPNLTFPGTAVTFTATVNPAPDAGTISFTNGGAPVGGCNSAAVSPATSHASCTITFSRTGSQTIKATYSGDPYYLASTGSLTEIVASSAVPRISHLRVSVVRRKLRLKLRLSQRATLFVVVSKLVPGRLVRHRCRPDASRGRPCQAARRRAILGLFARAGRHTLRPRMRMLPPGRYAITVTALGASGKRSKPVRTVVDVGGPANGAGITVAMALLDLSLA
jgi:outer membrane protein assembly factor BamB